MTEMIEIILNTMVFIALVLLSRGAWLLHQDAQDAYNERNRK